MKSISMFLVIMMSLLLVVSCGDDDEDSSSTNTIDVSVDKSKSVDDLSADEAVTVCEEVFAGMEDAAMAVMEIQESKMCELMGASTAGMMYTMSEGDITNEELVSACEETVTACEDASEGEPDTEYVSEEPDCSDAEALVGMCPVTIGEILDCFNDQIAASQAAAQAAVASVPACADITADSFSDTTDNTYDEAAIPASCESLYAECPALMAMSK